jgi:hypothetical protein
MLCKHALQKNGCVSTVSLQPPLQQPGWGRCFCFLASTYMLLVRCLLMQYMHTFVEVVRHILRDCAFIAAVWPHREHLAYSVAVCTTRHCVLRFLVAVEGRSLVLYDWPQHSALQLQCDTCRQCCSAAVTQLVWDITHRTRKVCDFVFGNRLSGSACCSAAA